VIVFMKIFELRPIADNKLIGSIYAGGVIVCAKDEKSARRLANMKFGIAVPKPLSGENIVTLPWSNPKVVNCIEIDGSEFPQDKAGIIKKIS
jgi:hypothetical protein